MNMKKSTLAAIVIGLLCGANAVNAADLVESQYQAAPNKTYTQNGPEITVANYNIAGGLRKHKVDLDAVAQAIKDMNADIITLEEVDQNTTRNGNVDQLKILAEKTGMHYSFGKAIENFGGNYGIGILSKYPIEKTHVFKMPSGDYEARVLMISKINVPNFDAPIYMFNTHFDWHEEDEVRMSQARFINSIVFDDLDLDDVFPDLASGIRILAGDFNSTKQDRVVSEFRKYWDLVEAPGVDTRTWPAGNPGMDLDHIFTGRGQKWKVEELTIPNTSPTWKNTNWATTSDHIPVIAKLKLVEQ